MTAFDKSAAEAKPSSADLELLSDPRLELLADKKGVYGVGFPDGDPARTPRLILRPDRLEEPRSPAVLQTIPSWQFFRGSAECELADARFTALLSRAGLERFSRDQSWWSDNHEVQAKNRRHYHALKRQAIWINNRLVRQALASAPIEAIRISRRFPPSLRDQVYGVIAGRPRVMQLAETFPLLAARLTGQLSQSTPSTVALEALKLVERGAPLKAVANLMHIPMVLRRVKPGVTRLALEAFTPLFTFSVHEAPDPDLDPGYVDLARRFLPSTTVGQRIWLSAMLRTRSHDTQRPYDEWTARNALALGTSQATVMAQVDDIGDWVEASQAEDGRAQRQSLVNGLALPADEPMLITRPFEPSMSVRTVRRLSGQWHEAVALAGHNSTIPIPAPWRESERVRGFDFVPLRSSADIAAEGRAMHNCVARYIESVARGKCYLYGVRDGDTRIATVEVRNQDGKAVISQARGPCNTVLPISVAQTVSRWVHRRDRWSVPPLPNNSKI